MKHESQITVIGDEEPESRPSRLLALAQWFALGLLLSGMTAALFTCAIIALSSVDITIFADRWTRLPDDAKKLFIVAMFVIGFIVSTIIATYRSDQGAAQINK